MKPAEPDLQTSESSLIFMPRTAQHPRASVRFPCPVARGPGAVLPPPTGKHRRKTSVQCERDRESTRHAGAERRHSRRAYAGRERCGPRAERGMLRTDLRLEESL